MALQFAGYKYKLGMTDGGHSGKWGDEGLPEVLKWLWSDKAESTKLPHVETKPEWTPHPDAVAKADVPIHVYMADTSGDVDKIAGSWPWANQQMASALKSMVYDVRFDWAEGYAHNSDKGRTSEARRDGQTEAGRKRDQGERDEGRYIDSHRGRSKGG